MTRRALLLDVDGTLVDSTYTHVATWWRALDSAGARVPHHEIHRRIGMDGSTLLDELLDVASVPSEDRESVGSQAESRHSAFFAEATLRLLPGARELIRGAHDDGWVTVLATSAPPEEFGRSRELLDMDDHLYAVTTGEDVDQAKPDPTIVQIALDRAGVAAEHALVVGDATWDALAAGRLGVRSVAVRTGGIGEAELREAGFSDVVDDAAAVLDLIRRESA